MSKDDKALSNFINNPRYREQVLNSLRKEEDKAYKKKVQLITAERDKLVKERTSEMNIIDKSRWSIEYPGFEINRTEGKVRINNNGPYSFSDLQGADINVIEGCRIITNEQSKSKKSVSLGGAVVGGLVSGPVGAVVGGVGLGKTTTKGSTISNQIPTCSHLGVFVFVNGRVEEIVCIKHEVDQSSNAFKNEYSNANQIIAKIKMLINMPIPQNFIAIENVDSVLAITEKIKLKEIELQEAIEDTPKYQIPLSYRTEEQKELSDEDYLAYLRTNDEIRKETLKAQRKEKTEQTINNIKDKSGETIDNLKCKTDETIDNIKNYTDNFDVKSTSKKLINLIFTLAFWFVSLIGLLFTLASIMFDKNIFSGVFFLISAIIINPSIRNIVANKWKKIPLWIIIILFFVTFFTAAFNL